MGLTRAFAVFLRQVFLFKSNPTRLTSLFLWLIIDIVQWGFISKYLGSIGQSTFGLITAILGAIVLWGFVVRIQQGIMTSFLEDVWSQNFVNFFASPLTIVEYLSGLVITSIVTSLAGFIMVVIIAGVAFGYNVFTVGLMLIPFMAILLIFAMAMGIFISGVIFRLGPSAEWLGWPIPLVLSIFSCVFYPVTTLPTALQVIARLIPASYVFESLRHLISARAISPGLGSHLLLGALLALVYLAIAYMFFIRVYRRNLENGTIARFSAEAW
ncbi:MAG TPA: ABC transporter permease [Candidatus Acidoferrum sp.]|nr:ABC transporter permease [Candidatus Acidoferrum sp.]